MSTIVVTGATGTIGSQVVRALKAKGETVRAAVRNPASAKTGADEHVALDFEDPASLEAAFAGADKLFLLTPFIERFSHLGENAVAAAKKAGISFILRMSAFGADPNSDDDLAKQHGLGEVAAQKSGIDWAVIRPTFFQNNLVNFHSASIKAQQAFYGASDGKKTSYVSSIDVGEVAAEILSNSSAHSGKTYILTGPEAVTDEQVAAIISEIAGREVKYINLDPASLRQGMLDNQVPEWMATHVVALEGVKSSGFAEAVTPHVSEILGRPGRTIKATLAEYADAFRP